MRISTVLNRINLLLFLLLFVESGQCFGGEQNSMEKRKKVNTKNSGKSIKHRASKWKKRGNKITPDSVKDEESVKGEEVDNNRGEELNATSSDEGQLPEKLVDGEKVPSSTRQTTLAKPKNSSSSVPGKSTSNNAGVTSLKKRGETSSDAEGGTQDKQTTVLGKNNSGGEEESQEGQVEEASGSPAIESLPLGESASEEVLLQCGDNGRTQEEAPVTVNELIAEDTEGGAILEEGLVQEGEEEAPVNVNERAQEAPPIPTNEVIDGWLEIREVALEKSRKATRGTKNYVNIEIIMSKEAPLDVKEIFVLAVISGAADVALEGINKSNKKSFKKVQIESEKKRKMKSLIYYNLKEEENEASITWLSRIRYTPPKESEEGSNQIFQLKLVDKNLQVLAECSFSVIKKSGRK